MKPKRRSTVYNTLFGSMTGPLASGPRDDLDTSLRSHTVSQPFTKALFSTNRRLGMQGDYSLDDSDAQRYKRIAKGVESGEMSNSYAFGSSALYWAAKGKAAGALLNAGGFLFSGTVDALNDKRKRYGGY